eukprot:680840-Pleurochrysis_carterae.AAC.3
MISAAEVCLALKPCQCIAPHARQTMHSDSHRQQRLYFSSAYRVCEVRMHSWMSDAQNARARGRISLR